MSHLLINLKKKQLDDGNAPYLTKQNIILWRARRHMIMT